MPSVKISISRRQLLQVGVVGSAVLSTAGLLGGAGQIFAAAPAGGEFLALSSAGRDILRAIVPVVLEGSLPSDAAERADSVEQVLRAVDFYLAHLPESVHAEAEQAFSLLSLAPVRILLAGVWQRWPEAAPAEVAKFLNAWRGSSFELLRSVYVFLQSMVSIGWYDQPRAWVPMGYAGPPASSLSLPVGESHSSPSGTVDKREWPLDTAPEKMGPTRGERGKPSEINMEPLAPSSRPLLAAYRGVPAGRKSTVPSGRGLG